MKKLLVLIVCVSFLYGCDEKEVQKEVVKGSGAIVAGLASAKVANIAAKNLTNNPNTVNTATIIGGVSGAAISYGLIDENYEKIVDEFSKLSKSSK